MDLNLEIIDNKVQITEIKYGEDIIRIGTIINVPSGECTGEVKNIRMLRIEDYEYFEIISKTIDKGKLEYTSDFHFLLPGTEYKITQ